MVLLWIGTSLTPWPYEEDTHLEIILIYDCSVDQTQHEKSIQSRIFNRKDDTRLATQIDAVRHTQPEAPEFNSGQQPPDPCSKRS